MTTNFYPVLSVEALRDGNFWTWNNVHARGTMSDEEIESFAPDGTLNARRFIAAMRARGFNIPAGVAAAEDDGRNYVVVQKNTREPWCAVDYLRCVNEDGTDRPFLTRCFQAGEAVKLVGGNRVAPLHWHAPAPMSAEQLHTLLGDNRARIVGSQRARVLRKRGLDVRYAYDTTQGKRRYIWLMPIDTGTQA
ncbi:hypothetical protein ADP64_000070 [Achromobacter phage phiAxp-2]|uniref:Uncharacterized protein n=1 Tax=Achromobacter phage phiAxp-2 TaxID=1664246 RepID=A0A0K2FHR6_9CAUD|nr:hypothetical protein ADP64_000070 [Achromobacter phage phiAxp-2]ALA45400.1 hypothetical protein ADP64_000070 [Achromobacter phage phiAxp-2]